MHGDTPEDAAQNPKKTGGKKSSGKKASGKKAGRDKMVPKSAAPISEPTAPADPDPAAAGPTDAESTAENPAESTPAAADSAARTPDPDESAAADEPAAVASDAPPTDVEDRVIEKVATGTPAPVEARPVESDAAKADHGEAETEKSATQPPPAPASPAPPTPEPRRIPPRDSGRSRRPHALPQRIEPTQTAKPKKSRKKLWGWLVGIVVLALLIAAAVVGFVLYDRHQDENSPETRIRATIDTFTTALAAGDLATLRTSSCGELATFYRDIPDDEFAEVHRVAVEQGNIPTIDAVDAINLESDTTAIAQVIAYTDANPDDRSPRTFDLSLDGEQWKVCSN